MAIVKTFKLYSNNNINKLCSDVINTINNHLKLTEESEFNIKLIIAELSTNSLKYGGSFEKKPIIIDLYIDIDRHFIELSVKDQGSGFIRHTKDYKADIEAESGRGLMLVEALSETLTYNNIGNQVTVHINV